MKKLLLFTLLFFTLGSVSNIYAQFGEPEVEEMETPRNLFDEGYRKGFGFHFALNDFGFGAGVQYRAGLATYTEAIINFKIAGLKDPTEQAFVDYWGGRIIPEKYQRVISFPLQFGIKRRFFAEGISDNFRLFSSLSGGPVFALSFPYFDDRNENGFRESSNYASPERVYDIFQGWGQAKTHWGVGSELMIGLDFGENFANLSTVQFGFVLNYFPDGIQILEPYQADLETATLGNQGGYTVITEYDLLPAHDPRKLFGSAQISFTFGWMW